MISPLFNHYKKGVKMCFFMWPYVLCLVITVVLAKPSAGGSAIFLPYRHGSGMYAHLLIIRKSKNSLKLRELIFAVHPITH